MFLTSQGSIKPIVYVGIIREGKLLLVDYHVAPNPERAGWWIPAPGLEFGEDPLAKAQSVLRELGFDGDLARLQNVESFVLPGGWHLVYHFVARVDREPCEHGNVRAHRWTDARELETMKDLAHGNWEAKTGRRYLLDAPRRLAD